MKTVMPLSNTSPYISLCSLVTPRKEHYNLVTKYSKKISIDTVIF